MAQPLSEALSSNHIGRCLMSHISLVLMFWGFVLSNPSQICWWFSNTELPNKVFPGSWIRTITLSLPQCIWKKKKNSSHVDNYRLFSMVKCDLSKYYIVICNLCFNPIASWTFIHLISFALTIPRLSLTSH